MHLFVWFVLFLDIIYFLTLYLVTVLSHSSEWQISADVCHGFIFAMTARPLYTGYLEGLIRCESLWFWERTKSVRRMHSSGHDASRKQAFTSLGNTVNLNGV